MSSVYLLTLRQLSGRWRILIMSILAAMPAVIAVLMVGSSDAPSVREFETAIISAMLFGSIAPLVVLAIGGPAFANEIEDRTLANLTLTPLPRWQIVVPKLLATFTVAAPFIGISAFVTSYFAFLGDAQAIAAVTLAAVFCVALYSAAFVWLGLVSTQPIGVGLLYIVLWEGLFSRFVSGVRLLSIRDYSLGLMHGLDARRFASGTHFSLPAVIIVSLIVFSGLVFLSIRRLRRMDVP